MPSIIDTRLIPYMVRYSGTETILGSVLRAVLMAGNMEKELRPPTTTTQRRYRTIQQVRVLD